jgi:hypothetical protein
MILSYLYLNIFFHYTTMMNYNEPNSRIGYWKRYFDDERRNKVFHKRPEPLIRKSKTIEQREMHALKKEIDTYRGLYLTEQQKQEILIAELMREKEKSRRFQLQLQGIKKCLLKASYDK